MAAATTEVRRDAHTKIPTRIVAALEKACGKVQTPGLHLDWGAHTDTWLALPPDVAKQAWSDDSMVTALEKACGIPCAQGACMRFGDAQQGADVWLPLPADLWQGECSADEARAVAGRSILIRWDILPGTFGREGHAGDVMLLGFGTFPATFFRRTA